MEKLRTEAIAKCQFVMPNMNPMTGGMFAASPFGFFNNQPEPSRPKASNQLTIHPEQEMKSKLF